MTAILVQFRRGTTTENEAFTGEEGEITVDTDLLTARVHDGTTAGGAILANQDWVTTAIAATVSGNANNITLALSCV